MKLVPFRPARHAEPAPTAGRFEALVLPHTDAAYRLALRLTRSPEAAEDVVHDGFLRALSHFESYRGGDIRAWLLSIVRNRAFDWLRERQRKATVALAPSDDPDTDMGWYPHDPNQETPEQALLRKGDAISLNRLVDALPPRLREVLVLREIEDLSYRQIAEITGSPIGTVMSRLARARSVVGEAWRRQQAVEAGRP